MFVVSSVGRTIAFYRDTLGFSCWYQHPDTAPFFAIMGRDEAMLFVKSGDARPQPNPTLDPEIRWDSYVLTRDPDALATELLAHGAKFSQPLSDTHEGLRGFEITDPDGYVLFFGRPRTP